MIKKLLKSVVGLLIAIALLALGALFGLMAMVEVGFIQIGLAFMSLTFVFMFFRWLVFLAHRE